MLRLAFLQIEYLQKEVKCLKGSHLAILHVGLLYPCLRKELADWKRRTCQMLRLDTYISFLIFFGALCVLSDYRFNMVQLYQHTLFLEADIKHFSTFYGLLFSQRFCSELNKFSDGMVISTPTIYLYWVNFSCEFLCRDTWNDVKGLKLDEKNLSRSWWRPMSRTWKQDVCGAAQKNKGLLHQAVRERKQGTYSDRPWLDPADFESKLLHLVCSKCWSETPQRCPI